jgi:hypothetical protein
MSGDEDAYREKVMTWACSLVSLPQLADMTFGAAFALGEQTGRTASQISKEMQQAKLVVERFQVDMNKVFE